MWPTTLSIFFWQEQADTEENSLIAEKLSEVLKEQFEGRIFPDTPTKENIAESVEQPLFVIFRLLIKLEMKCFLRGLDYNHLYLSDYANYIFFIIIFIICKQYV